MPVPPIDIGIHLYSFINGLVQSVVIDLKMAAALASVDYALKHP